MKKNKQKHVFIDTNIFLDFYRLSQKDLDELKKLVESIKNGEIKIYLTKQVYNEFIRNREKVFKETFDNLKKVKEDDSFKDIFSANAIFKNYSEYNKVSKIKTALEKLKSDLIQKVKKDINDNKLVADLIIKEIFDEIGIINSDIYLEKAIKRMQLGNPPGKNNSYGDAINWELLLEKIPLEEDIILVVRDGDFLSEMSKIKPHPFLNLEWKKCKKSKIYLYNSLSEFFHQHDLGIQLEEVAIKNELIENLNNSKNFSSTHYIISRLSEFDFFDKDQAKKIANAIIGNSQVGWISDDSDVKSFYKKVFTDKLDIFDDQERSHLESYILLEKNEINKELDEIIKSVDESEMDEKAPF
ncbi:MAG: DUF4935 domain-containing protein [Candidatus Moranbacteria bacterium]|nr:DUF4935 domain-containing protein [Candidatus Moranbacteria bacterium]